MSKLTKAVLPISIILLGVFTVVWQVLLSKSVNYYIVSLLIILVPIILSIKDFEKNNKTAIEISFTAVMVAIAVVSRSVFYLIPQVKPIAAVVIVFAVCAGEKYGFFIGATSAFVSNFLFGQGIWTPFQMLALGLIGFLAGVFFKRVKPKRMQLAIFGLVSVGIFYGLIVDISSIFMILDKITFAGIVSIYSSGFLFNLAFAISTAVFLLIFGEQFVKKIDRIKKKYGLFGYTLET